MAVPPIKPSVIVALIGGYGAPDEEIKPVTNPTLAHVCAEWFFIAVLLLALWAIGRTVAETDSHDGY